MSAFADYLLENGLASFSLRPAAAALGVNTRVLLYHFGSKERLITAALEEIRARQVGGLAGFGSGEPNPAVDQIAWRVWKWFTSKQMDAFLRLFFEVWGLALRDPKRFGRALEALKTDLLVPLEEGLIAAGVPRRQGRVLATFYLATFRGLLLDMLTTGDETRVDAAFELGVRDLSSRFKGRRSSRDR